MAKLEEYKVQPQDEIVIRGKVAYSRVASMIDGEELQERIKKEKARGSKFPTERPHTTISLADVELEEKYKGTPLGNFYGENVVYQSKSGKNAGKYMVNLESKSPNLPTIWQRTKDGEPVQIKIDKELAPGQEVALVIRAYESKNYNNMGSSYNDIIVPEDVKFYEGGGGSRTVKAFGEDLELDPANTGAAQTTEEKPAVTVVPESDRAELPDAFRTVPADAKPEPTVANDNPFSV